jgi:hypothetical protein
MDNERPIEKLLRDYAKKRRADAGEPREMHPATRRLLQGEVARQFPKAKRGSSSLAEFFARWRPGLVYGICALVVLAVGVPLLLTTFRKGDPEFQLAKGRPEEVSADKNLRTAAPTMSAAPPARAADEKLLTPAPERSHEAGQTALAFADADQAKDDARGLRRDLGKEKSEAAPPPSPDGLVRDAAASSPAAPQIASLAQSSKRAAEAEGRLEPSTQVSRPAVAEQPPATSREVSAARSPGVTPAPATAPTAAAPEADAFRQRYGIPMSASAAVAQKPQSANTARFRRSTSAGANASPVLTTFQFEQVGGQLRVIDSDGSTYAGTISLPAAGAYEETKVELKGGPVKKTSSAPDARTLSTAAGDHYQAGQNYFFRVTGTNRTLKQPVIFAGNLLILTNAIPSGPSIATQSPVGQSQTQLAPAQNQLPSLVNSTISGSVQLGAGKEMKFNAVPVNP